MRTTSIYFLVFTSLLSCGTNDNNTYKTTEIKSNKINEILFIKTMNWGLTGDSQITTISTTDKIDFTKKQSEDYYIFKGLEPFLYRQSGDSLILYSQTIVKIPKSIKTKWKIIQKITDNATLMDLRRKEKVKIP